MSSTSLVLVLFSGMGLGLSSFFGIYLFISKNIRSISNKLLALLIIALSIRIGKAVFYSITDLPLFVKNIGLAANLAAGPLLYFYVKSLFRERFEWSKINYLHFVPFVIYALFCWAIPNGTRDLFWKVSYSFILIQSYTYVGLSFAILYRNTSEKSRQLVRWAQAVIIGLLLVWVVYGLVFVQVVPYHIAGAISFSGLMIAMLFVAINKRIIFENESSEKYQNSKISDREASATLDQIKNVIKQDQLFLNPDLTVNRLADKAQLSPKLISECINRLEHQNFVTFINTYRIEEAKDLLLDQEANHKVAAVAFKSGFNSLSAFNEAFKKHTALTPSEFRRINLKA